MSYDPGNVQNKKQTKEETSFNVCAQRRLLTKSVNCSKCNNVKIKVPLLFPYLTSRSLMTNDCQTIIPISLCQLADRHNDVQ